jgi:hypothetical protein
MRGDHAARRKFILQPMQCQMWGLIDTLRDEGAMRFENTSTMAAYLAGRNRTS